MHSIVSLEDRSVADPEELRVLGAQAAGECREADILYL
jgi:hypothetical protein